MGCGVWGVRPGVLGIKDVEKANATIGGEGEVDGDETRWTGAH